MTSAPRVFSVLGVCAFALVFAAAAQAGPQVVDVSVTGGIDRVIGGTVAATITAPTAGGLAANAAGDLFLAEHYGADIYEITPGGVVSTFGTTGFLRTSAVAVDASGNVYAASYDGSGSRVLKFTPGGGSPSIFVPNSGGLTQPSGLAFDASGNLYVTNNGWAGGAWVSEVTPDGTVSTLATLGNEVIAVAGIAVDAAGNVYVGALGDGIDKITQAGNITVWASSFSGSGVYGMQFGSDGNLYVTDNIARNADVVSPTGTVLSSTYLGASAGPLGLALTSEEVPEPASMLLLAGGLAGLGCTRRRR